MRPSQATQTPPPVPAARTSRSARGRTTERAENPSSQRLLTDSGHIGGLTAGGMRSRLPPFVALWAHSLDRGYRPITS
jgi:hypothetical protein